MFASQRAKGLHLPRERKPFRAPSFRLLVLVTLTGAVLGGTAIAYALAWLWAGQRIQQESRDRLALYETTLDAAVERYRHLPEVIALSGPIRILLDQPDDRARVDLANLHLKAVAQSAQADTLFVMNREGLTLASSNAGEPNSFVGQNYAFRPYFQHAMETGSGRYYAVGATSGRPGYFLASRIDGPEGPLGVAVVKVDLSPMEAEWRRAGEAVALLDQTGIAFLATKPDWLYRPLTRLSESEIAYLDQTRKYGSPPRIGAPLVEGVWTFGALSTVDLRTGVKRTDRFFDLRQPLAAHGWEILYLAPLGQADRAAMQAAFVAAVSGIALILGGVIWRDRRDHARQRERAREELERRVEERTHALAATNTRLSREIEEREATEAALRKAQDGLIQSAKLAGLGQGLAGIAHEIAQPLAALRVSLASLRHFIAARDQDRALASTGDLAAIVERVENLSAELRNFARPSPEKPRIVALQDVVAGAISIIEHRLRGTMIRLERPMIAESVLVEARVNRLEQVIVNLLGNALDATLEAQRALPGERLIRIGIERRKGIVLLKVEDEGTGLGEYGPETLFEPFVSSKAAGQGLGLGLSISRAIMREHRGDLTLAARSSGGACATLSMPLARLENAA